MDVLVIGPWVVLIALALLLLALRLAALHAGLARQSSREASFLAEQVSDWRDQFTGSIDEFRERDAREAAMYADWEADTWFGAFPDKAARDAFLARQAA